MNRRTFFHTVSVIGTTIVIDAVLEAAPAQTPHQRLQELVNEFFVQHHAFPNTIEMSADVFQLFDAPVSMQSHQLKMAHCTVGIWPNENIITPNVVKMCLIVEGRKRMDGANWVRPVYMTTMERRFLLTPNAT